MRFLLYFVLAYLFLPLNKTIDFITILVYFIILNEDERFSIAFAFFAGLLIDLYYPVSLGLNIMIFLILCQALIFLKKYFLREPFTLTFVFSIFYLLRILINFVVNGKTFHFASMIFTIIFSLPVIYLLNKICFRVWMKN
ncbi:MAG: rod shape-determining protein MreD [bacterium]